MTNRQRAISLALFCAFQISTSALCSAQNNELATPNEQQSKPNIILLLADDQCTYSLGCYGNDDVKTPNLDQLSAEGLTFDAHYVTTAICMASRASIMTGLYEYRHGCNFEHVPLLNEHWQMAYPLRLRRAGYRTAMAGKIGFVVADKPAAKGKLPVVDFDAWAAGPGQTHYETHRNPSIAHYADRYPHATRAYGAFAADFIRESVAAEQPFCLSISFKAPHRPVQPDPAFDSVYQQTIFRKPANYGRRYGEHLSLQSRQGRQYVRFEEWGYKDNYNSAMAKYHQQVYGIDVAVGMIREALETNDCADNTVIIYTSDNGFMCGSHGYGSKVLPYEESSRVPLIVYDPRASSSHGKRTQSLTGSIDLAPTILALAGVEPLGEIDGKDLTPLLANVESSIRQSITLINVWGPRPVYSLAVVSNKWKYIYWPYNQGEFEPTEELYNLSEDPLELTNAAVDEAYAKEKSAMRQIYDSAVQDWRSKGVSYHKYDGLDAFFRRK